MSPAAGLCPACGAPLLYADTDVYAGRLQHLWQCSEEACEGEVLVPSD